MGNCCSKPKPSESINPPHRVSTPSSAPRMEPSPPTLEDPVRRSPAVEPSLAGNMARPSAVKFSLPALRDPMRPSTAVEPSLPGDPARPSPAMKSSLPSSGDPLDPSASVEPFLVEPSLPSLEDPVHPPPPMYPSRDAVCPSLPVDSSMTTSRHLVLSSPPMYTIESIKEKWEKKDPVEVIDVIDLLVNFIETQLRKMDTAEVGSSSSHGSSATIGDVTKFAADAIDNISSEAEKLSQMDVVKAMGRQTLKVMKGAGQLHLVFLGLSVAAYAIESYVNFRHASDECKQILLKIVELAKDVRKCSVHMLEEKEKVQNVILTIVLGATVCCNYAKRGKFFRYLSATTAAAQLEKINNQLSEARNSLDFSVNIRILQKLPMHPEQSPLHLLEIQPVDIEKQKLEVRALLDMEGPESALAVIVYGFGGVGKSTLAASVVQSLDWASTDFKFCRVAIDDKTTEKTSHIIKLQKRILYVLGGVEVDLQDTLVGQQEIKQALQNKCCLLFIDNVVDKEYIEELLPKKFIFPPGQKTKLRIIITSRENNLNAELKMRRIILKEYEVKCLSKPASKQLLMESIVVEDIYFFQEEFEGEEHMINELAAECRGVPLLLSVFGRHLSVERNIESYRDALDFLREGDLDIYKEEDLGKRLMYVYHKIKEMEVKEAFLDICRYFHGWEWNHVIEIVDFHQLNDLRSRALVSRSSSGEVIVHDILRFMGMKEDRFTRFSNYQELSDGLEKKLVGFENVKGISLLNDNRLITIKSSQLEAMCQSLRVLMLGDWVTLDGPPCHTEFGNLRYLRVGDITAFPFKDPSKLAKLKVFLNRSKPGMDLCHLPSSLKRVSHEVPVDCNTFANLPLQNLSSLKSLIVKTQKSVELPEELHLPTSLLDLHLNICKNLPKDIGHLTNLESLILDKSDLERLLEGFDKLKKLKHLSIDHCSKLTELSDELGMLSSLEALSMKGCRSLRALPENLGGLLSLQTIEFSECITLQELPEGFGELRIQSLNLHVLVNLIKLPNSFGNMIFLKDLTLESCDSLISLPDTFVQLKMLETLKILKCTKLNALPEDFGRLTCLKSMTVEECHDLKELPPGFEALPALKTFALRWCKSFVNFPRDFRDLISLEKLYLQDLPLMSRIPDGLGKLKKLRFLYVSYCSQLKTLSNDFENMATLEQLWILHCPDLEGAMMEKILKLPKCYRADIDGSKNLLKKWEHLQGESKHPMVVVCKVYERDREEKKRTTRVALLHGKCMEVNNATHQLMERSSLFVGLEQGSTATVALFMLPIHIQPHQYRTLQQFVEMERKRAETSAWDKLQIVFARKVDLDAERPTSTEAEARAEEEDIRQILLLLPKGSCVIPSSECKRVKILTYCIDLGASRTSNDKLSIFTANVWSDSEGCKIFENVKFIDEDEISGNVPPPLDITKAENKHYNSIQNFIKSICPVTQHPQHSIYSRIAEGQSESQCVPEESKTIKFTDALKDNGIRYLLNNTRKVMVDDLHGKTIGFIICDFLFLKCINLQQIYKDLQQKDSNFIWIWIPTEIPKGGHGSYTRLIQCMPWATCPYPQLVKYPFKTTYFVLINKHGQIANRDALPLLLAWGVKSYPFIQHTIPESLVDSESCLEFFLQGMNIIGRKQMKRKITFLYAEDPSRWLKMKSKLEELFQIHGYFEVLYVGNFSEEDISSIENLRRNYETAAQNMRWPSLSLSDMIKFWYRCKHLASKKSSTMMQLHEFATQLYLYRRSLVLVDKGGPVTYRGEDVVQMICEPSHEIWAGEGREMKTVQDELMKSLHRGECSSEVKTFFRDEIHNDPPQHP